MLKRKIIFAFLSILIIASSGCDDLLTIDATDNSDGLTLAKKMSGIWIVGGFSDTAGSSAVREIDMFDPVTGTWYSNVASSASGSYTPTGFNMSVSVSGKIYVIGGATSNTTVVTNVSAYDVASNSWENKASITLARMDAVVGTLQNKIYIIGGTSSITTAGVATTIYIYDITTNTWSTSATVLPAARTGFAYYNNYGALSYAGGRINTGVAQTTNDIYQIIQNVFTGALEQVLSALRFNMATAGNSGTYGTYMFMVGGAASMTTANAYFGSIPSAYVPYATSFIVYNPPAIANGILIGTPHPSFVNGVLTSGIVFAAAAVSPYNGSTSINPTLYVFGGLKNQAIVTTDVHSITANGETSGANYAAAVSWTTNTSMPRARLGHSAVTIQQ